MKKMSFYKTIILLFPILFLFTACPHGAVGYSMVTQVVKIIGKRAGNIAIAEAVKYGMDKVFSAIFSDTANKSSDVYNDSVIPFRDDPRFGYLRYDGEFAVKSARHGRDLGINTIRIGGEFIVFARTQFGTWELTTNSRAMIKERIEVATAQQVLKGYNYNPGRVDGILGPKTNRAAGRFQKDYPNIFGNRPSEKLDYQTRQVLLTYKTN